MTPAELRKELGELELRARRLEMSLHSVGSLSAAECVRISVRLSMALDYIIDANAMAGKLLVAQLTDADRAQADEAAGRA